MSETLKNMDITRAYPKWTSNYCYEHIPAYAIPAEPSEHDMAALQEKFRVQMMEQNGNEVCPRCVCEQATKVLEDEAREVYNRDKDYEKHDIFARQSVFKDSTLENASFDTYVLDDSEHEARVNKQDVLRYVEDYKRGQQFNLWLTGNVGVGKSHLSMSMLKELNSLKISCCFIEVDEMFRLILDAKFDNKESPYTEKYFIDLANSVDFLVLDDIGAETGNVNTEKEATDYTSKILRAIINGRQDKSTIFTTNLNFNQIVHMYDDKLVDRMFKLKRIVKFTSTISFRSRDIDF